MLPDTAPEPVTEVTSAPPEPMAGSASHRTERTRTIAAGEFKAKCLKLLDEVAETREPLIVTKFGKPVARVLPIENGPPDIFGAMRGTVLWEGDIISPLGEDAWGWFAEP